MKPKLLKIKKNFVGRRTEWETLSQLGEADESAIIILYGRRRVGKTELLEQVYRTRNILKFEGLEAKSEKDQIRAVMLQLAEYVEDPIVRDLKPESWMEVFRYIARYVTKGKWTVYFEETQWLANYQPAFVSELKYAWDNYFRYNDQLLLILCGSSPSFMIRQVVESKALYNRSQHEVRLRELNLIDARKMLPKSSIREVLDAYLTVGGIPEYLKRLNKESSVFTSLCKHSFLPDSYFSQEYKRIFASSMAENKHYQAVISFLGRCKFATREMIAKHLKVQQGGSLSNLLIDLVLCGFIQKYSPYHLNEKSTLARYCIDDAYLQFFYQFIQPLQKRISTGDFAREPVNAIKIETYQKWLGFSFERFCRKYHYVIANLLGFGAIQYQVGPFYNKRTNLEAPNFQMDLLFDRKDGIYTICEIKYLQSKVGVSIIDEMERKIALLPNCYVLG